MALALLIVGSPSTVTVQVSGGSLEPPYWNMIGVSHKDGQYVLEQGEDYNFIAAGIEPAYPFCVDWPSAECISGNNPSDKIDVSIPTDYNEAITYYSSAEASMTMEFFIAEPCLGSFYEYDDAVGQCRVDTNDNGVGDQFAPSYCCLPCDGTLYELDDEGKCRVDTNDNGVVDQFAAAACCLPCDDALYEWDEDGNCRVDTNSNGVVDQFAPNECCPADSTSC